MTSPLRRKRPTTAPARSRTPARTTARFAAPLLAGLGLLLGAGAAAAQSADAYPPPPPLLKHKPKPQDQFADQRSRVVPAQAMTPGGPADVSTGEYQFLVATPSAEVLFRLDTENEFQVRLEQEWRDNGHKDRLTFPEEPVISRDKYLGRAWPQYSEIVEPNFVCYKRLMFEQLNYERQGWDLGVLDPPLSACAFFADVALLPYHAFTDPFRTFECSAGYCLPGDPTPLLIYPPELSASGTVAEAGAILGVFAVFP